MPAAQETTPSEVRRVVLVQLGLTAAFLVVVFVLLQGLDADFPPIWLVVVVLLIIGVGAFLAERAWLGIAPLAADAAEPEAAGLDAFVAHTTRKFVICEAALLVCVLIAFASNRAGWLVVVAGVPGLVVLAFETWPGLRNVSLAQASLDARGTRSNLVDQFLDS